jgi:hypothetical protein
LRDINFATFPRRNLLRRSALIEKLDGLTKVGKRLLNRIALTAVSGHNATNPGGSA